MKRVLRGLCSARLSGNSYLVVGALVAFMLAFVPVGGPAFAPIAAAAFAVLGAFFTATIIGILLGPVIL